jgi:predicted transcriptional regulator
LIYICKISYDVRLSVLHNRFLMSKQYTISEASEVLGISQRAVKHYRAIYTSEVIKETDGRVFLTQRFIDKVEKTRALDKNKVTDSRTKTDLLDLIQDQKSKINALIVEVATLKANEGKKSNDSKDDKILIQVQKAKIDVLDKEVAALKNGKPKKSNDSKGDQDFIKEIAELKEIIADYENSTVLEGVKDSDRIELFSQEEYAVFEERLIQWRLQRQEIELTKVHFASTKEELAFVKSRLDYAQSSNEKILQQHQNLIEIIGQRNRIEAVEKSVIKPEPREI